MARNKDVPLLLERFMEESGKTQHWVTVNEFRTYFDLDECSAPAISGFLRRIYHGPFFSCQYRVQRIEKVVVQNPQRRTIKRYLVTKRPQGRQKNPAGVSTLLSDTSTHGFFTDYDAIEHFDRVLREKCDGNYSVRGNQRSTDSS
ncbi:MAG: hypothetical protein M0R30_11360 [Methanoregula sp.]|jgi:hypothetical protein|uniref:hypothetical protein n=1 Tax=Methanoregula sp. TaxID=2052170 RepID=UPI0025D54A0C|nr:hypothetical protein [Methanoregula sp.]MCK9632222.1 hypothetical protein [Methanoregula sp.]